MMKKLALLLAALNPAVIALPVAAQQVTNLYNHVRSDALANTGYTAPSGALASIQAFATSGLAPVTSGQAYVFSLDATADNWVIDNAAIYFWTSGGAFSSRVTSGFTVAADLRSVKFTAPSTGFVSFNLKYTINGVYSSANTIPTGAVSALVTAVMMNKGTQAAAFSAYGTAGTIDIPTAAPDTVNNLLLLISGNKTYIRSGLASGYDLVHRFTVPPLQYAINVNFHFASWVRVAKTTKSQLTPGAFADGYAPTPTLADSYYIESDNMPAYKMNGPYLGGNHGLPSWEITVTGHGRTNANVRGSTWSNGGVSYMVTRIVDANRLWVTRIIDDGDVNNWIQNDPGIAATGTFTHVSGATSTADLVYTARVATQLRPSLQDFYLKYFAPGGKEITAAGAYELSQLRVKLGYKIPNQALLLDYLASIRGTANDVFYNSSGLASQVKMDLEYLFDRNGATTVYQTCTALQPHRRDYFWPSQHQNLTRLSGQTLHLFAEGVNSFQAGTTQAGGAARDFSALSDISSNALEYYFDKAAWEPGSYWSDGQQHIPSLFMFAIKDAGGAFLKKYVIVNDDEEGLSAKRPATRGAFLSSANKLYMVQAFSESVAADQVDLAVGAFGFIDPAADAQALVNFVYPKNGGRFGFRWHTLNGALSNYAIPVGVKYANKKVTILKRATTVTVVSSVVSPAGQIVVSTTGAGGFSAILE
jgi:hypothetical protein